MTAKELIIELQKHPDFEVGFVFTDGHSETHGFPNVRSFKNIEIADIGHSSKIIVLGGDERG